MTAPLALDRSLRTIDADGHMRVEESRISKANVCPYRGSEIPRWQELGLDPNRIYRLYRDASELAKAAPTFVGKPLLIRHVAIDGESPSQELWVGTIGACSFESPYLITRPLTVLTKEAIELIETGEQRELSSGYRYDAVMEAGSYDGHSYDGRMVNIRGNHVAIVSEGRAGPDVMVADEAPPELRSMKFPKLVAAIAKVLGNVTDEQKLALDAKLQDVAKDEGGLGETPARSTATLSADEMKEACDEMSEDKKRKGMDGSLSDEEKEEAYERARDKKRAKDAKAKDEKVDHRNDFESAKGKDAAAMNTGQGKDSSITMDQMNTAISAAVVLARKQERDAAVAREAVKPLVGAVDIALDSAEDIYGFALKQSGVKTDGIHPSAFAALIDVVKKNRKPTRQAELTPTIAADGRGSEDLASIFGALN